MGPAAYALLMERELLNNAKLLVVKRRNKYVHRFKLTNMKQGLDEPAIGFESCLQPVVRTGRFKKKGKCNIANCPGEIEVDYMEEMVLNNFVRGLADEEMKSKGCYVWDFLIHC